MALRVTFYYSPGCHLCERARDVLLDVRADRPFELAEVDISGDAELEERYRELLPVVEIDGRRRFAYFVPEGAFRRALDDAQSARSDATL